MEYKGPLEGSGIVALRTFAVASALCTICTILLFLPASAAENGIAVRALAPPAESTPVARDVRLGGDDKQTRFVVDLDRRVNIVAFTLADPYRVVIDLPQVAFRLQPHAGEHGRGLVKAFRYGLIMQGGSRIVLDTKGPVRVEKAFVLAAVDSQPARLGLDLSPTDPAAPYRYPPERRGEACRQRSATTHRD